MAPKCPSLACILPNELGTRHFHPPPTSPPQSFPPHIFPHRPPRRQSCCRRLLPLQFPLPRSPQPLRLLPQSREPTPCPSEVVVTKSHASRLSTGRFRNYLNKFRVN